MHIVIIYVIFCSTIYIVQAIQTQLLVAKSSRLWLKKFLFAEGDYVLRYHEIFVIYQIPIYCKYLWGFNVGSSPKHSSVFEGRLNVKFLKNNSEKHHAHIRPSQDIRYIFIVLATRPKKALIHAIGKVTRSLYFVHRRSLFSSSMYLLRLCSYSQLSKLLLDVITIVAGSTRFIR